MEINGLNKATLMRVEHDQRAKIWASHPNAKEISKKEYEEIKKLYDQVDKQEKPEVTQ